MNMKQSCKALICAIEGELDGRHCTEEQAAAILDHALPSLTEALARVEAERDYCKRVAGHNKALGERFTAERDTAQAQLAEAVGLLRYSQEIARLFDDEHTAEVGRFLDRHAQAEQQEAKPKTFLDYIQGEAPSSKSLREEEAQGARAGDDERQAALREMFQITYAGDIWQILGRLYDAGYRRAALATQPAAGEPIGKIVSFAPRLHEVSWHKGKLPPLGTELYAAPPASAHGDEAARKDATESAIQRACKELPEGWSMQIELERGAGDVTLFNAWDIVVDFGKDFESSISAQVEAAIDAAMRAQGDDRLLFTDAIMPGGMTET